jgi:hyaluronate lyase
MFKKSTAFALIVFLLMILLPVTDSVSASDEYDSLRLRWEEFLTGGTTFDPSDPDIANRIAEIDNTANDYWSTMNADNVWDDLLGTTISADITEAYGRLYSMALAWATNGSSLESDSSLLHDIIAGLDWMYANRYNENIVPYDNWFNWEIGTPLLLNNITVLLYDGLTSTQITNYMNAVDEFSPDATKSLNGTKTTFGANRVWKCMIVGLRGLIVKDSGKIAHSRDSMSPTFDYKDEGEGFYKDGSYLFHGKNPYNGGYGTGALLNTGNLLYLYAGSSWDFTDPDVENVYQWVFDSFEPFIYKGTVLEEVRGRSISRPIGNHAAGHDVIEAIVQMSELGSAHTSAYKSMIKYWLEEDTYANFYNNRSIFIISKAKSIRNDSSVAPRGELIVHKQFPQMDRVVHRRPGFSFSVSMSSERVKNYESINDENLKGWYYGDGATYLYTGALDEFSDNYWPTVDPYRLPGTTVDTQSRADASGQGSLSSESWVGGASIAGLYGMYGMQLDAWDSSLAAKKSWFMFDDEIVALGTDIESSDGRTIETIVENRKLNATGDNILTVNGTAKSSLLGWTETMNNVQWLHLDGTGGYYFPSATTLEGKREERQGSWYDINHRADTTPYVFDLMEGSWDQPFCRQL